MTAPTHRLYYDDPYRREFSATVLALSPDGTRCYLDRTALYPTSGGQLHDTGFIGSAAVLDVVDEGDHIAHIIGGSIAIEDVAVTVNWERRFDHMQQHSGQHLLSAVLHDLFGSETVSVHMGETQSTIELSTSALSLSQIELAEVRANTIVAENRPISVSYMDSESTSGLRKASERTGILRVVEIEGLDRSACGGTHVSATGAIGAILLRGSEKIRGNTRIEFLCGGRAVAQARSDYNALRLVAKGFSAPLDQIPSLVESQRHKLLELQKSDRKLKMEMASLRGQRLYRQAQTPTGGKRFHINRVETEPLDELVRAEAQGFTAEGNGIYLAVATHPPAILMAASADTGVHAGNVLKPLLAGLGGRGGGAATLAQGTVASVEQLELLVNQIRSSLLSE